MHIRIIITHAIIFLFFTFTSGIAFASSEDSTKSDKGIVVSYWGTVVNNPGLKLDLEKNYLQTSKYTVIGSVSLLLNRKPDIYTSAGLSFGSTLRRTGKCGVFLEHGIMSGYLGHYYDFNSYRTNSVGEIVNIGRKWVSSIILGYSVGMGYDFSKKTKTNLQIFLKPGIYYVLPNDAYNYYVNNYNIEIGLSFYPEWLNRSK